MWEWWFEVNNKKSLGCGEENVPICSDIHISQYQLPSYVSKSWIRFFFGRRVLSCKLINSRLWKWKKMVLKWLLQPWWWREWWGLPQLSPVAWGLRPCNNLQDSHLRGRPTCVWAGGLWGFIALEIWELQIKFFILGHRRNVHLEKSWVEAMVTILH